MAAIISFVLILSLVIPIVILLFFIGKVRIAVANGRYAQAIAILKKVPLISEANGLITPEYVSYLGLMANDLDFAEKYLQKGLKLGGGSIHYLLKFVLAGKKGDWVTATEALQQMQGAAHDSGMEGIRWDLLTAIVERQDTQALDHLIVSPARWVIDAASELQPTRQHN